MDTVNLIALALAPVIAIIVFVWFKGRYEKEPFRLLVLGFFLGAFSIIPTILLELLGNSFFDRMTMINTLIYAFLVVALCEEGMKFLIFRWVFYRKSDFNQPYDGIVYSLMISMGFAAAENIMYVLNHGFTVGVLRIFTAVPAHAGFAIIMGYFVGKGKFSTRFKSYFVFLGFFNAFLFHGLYDFFLMQNDYVALQLMAFVVLIICLILSFRALNKKRKHLFLNNTPEEDAEFVAELEPETQRVDETKKPPFFN